jgi:phosphate transport system substrate-binding protein
MKFLKALKVLTLSLLVVPSLLFGAEQVLVIQGSTTVLPIAQRAAEEFMKRHPGVEISVRGGGSGVGIAGLLDGTCDIAMSSREMKPEELQKAKEKGFVPKEIKIGLDGIAVIVNPKNPLKGLTLSQLKDIYTGKVVNWKELGWRDEKIIVVSRDSASGTFECFNEIVLKKEPLTPRALYQASNKAVAVTVSNTKGAIGYIGMAYLEPKVKALAVEGVMPCEETVRKGLYPISRPLFFYVKGEPKGLVKEFIDFVLSADGQKLVREVGYIPVK